MSVCCLTSASARMLEESTGSSTCEGSYCSIFRSSRTASSWEYDPLKSKPSSMFGPAASLAAATHSRSSCGFKPSLILNALKPACTARATSSAVARGGLEPIQ